MSVSDFLSFSLSLFLSPSLSLSFVPGLIFTCFFFLLFLVLSFPSSHVLRGQPVSYAGKQEALPLCQMKEAMISHTIQLVHFDVILFLQIKKKKKKNPAMRQQVHTRPGNGEGSDTSLQNGKERSA